jgi:cadmium resistance protein CadD (predicted permease)
MDIILTGILAFAATNIDDLFLLTLFFGNKLYPPGKIIAGQLMGISALIVISLAGSIIGYFIHPQYIGLMGLFPIYLGVTQLIGLFKNRHHDEPDLPSETKHRNAILAVALVTIANGGDNIGIYIPLFVTFMVWEKIITICIFLLMTILWCALSKYLANHPLLEKLIGRYSHIITPFVLILLGIFILYESNSWALVGVFGSVSPAA